MPPLRRRWRSPGRRRRGLAPDSLVSWVWCSRVGGGGRRVLVFGRFGGEGVAGLIWFVTLHCASGRGGPALFAILFFGLLKMYLLMVDISSKPSVSDLFETNVFCLLVACLSVSTARSALCLLVRVCTSSRPSRGSTQNASLVSLNKHRHHRTFPHFATSTPSVGSQPLRRSLLKPSP